MSAPAATAVVMNTSAGRRCAGMRSVPSMPTAGGAGRPRGTPGRAASPASALRPPITNTTS